MKQAPPWLEPRTAYLHIPFCGHHCGYCDFAVSAGRDDLIDSYLEAMIRELATLQSPRAVESLFIGGGTPTYLSAPQLERLLNAIQTWLPADATSPHLYTEFTIESTPESLDREKAAVLASFGVNRVSIGIQSFRNETLLALDRKHGVDQIQRAIDAVRPSIPALSFDLIFAAPGQTATDWIRDLDSALSLLPQHISTYGLTYEKGTPLWKQRERGQVQAAPEALELAMYLDAIDQLTSAGFEHYEVSNFALPGHQSQHNHRYWANEAYFGFGVGAARYVQGVRELNIRNTEMYIRKMQSGESPRLQSECLPPRERAFETMCTQLRRTAGIHRARFEVQTGYSLDSLVSPRLEMMLQKGLLMDTGDSVVLSRTGIHIADGIIADLLKAQ